MVHFPSQSDPSRSAYSSSSSRGGGGGGLGSRDGRSQAVLSASGNSYAVMVCTLVYTSVRVHDADVNQFRNLRPHHIRQEDGTKARMSEAAWWCMLCTGRSVGDSVVGGGWVIRFYCLFWAFERAGFLHVQDASFCPSAEERVSGVGCEDAE
jgi:hypothetical protein